MNNHEPNQMCDTAVLIGAVSHENCGLILCGQLVHNVSVSRVSL